MEMDLLMMVLKHLNMTFVHFPKPESFKIERDLTNNLIESMIAKDVFIALGILREHVIWLTHSWTPQILTTSRHEADIYRALTNV